MNRLFGKGKAKEPPPNLSNCIEVLDQRANNMDEKIKKLDAELFKYKEQMSKMREGPPKDLVSSKHSKAAKSKRHISIFSLDLNLKCDYQRATKSY